MIPEGWQICTVCGLMYEVGCECPGVALGEHTIDARSLFVSPAYAAEVERPDEGVVRCAKCARWHSGVNNADVKTNPCEDCAPSSERAVSEEERRDISELEGIRDGLRKSAIHKRDAARVTPDDYLRNTWNDKADEHDRQADFWQRIIDRLAARSRSSEPRWPWSGDSSDVVPDWPSGICAGCGNPVAEHAGLDGRCPAWRRWRLEWRLVPSPADEGSAQ